MIGLLHFIQSNPVFMGGAGIGIFGGILAYARNAPKVIWDYLFKQLTSSVTVTNEDAAYNWFKQWLERHPYSKKSRDVTATVGWSDMNELAQTFRKLNFTPAWGTHCFFYKRRMLWLSRQKEKESQDRQTGQQRRYEQITVRVVGRDKTVLMQLCEEIENLGKQERAAGFIDLYINRYGGWSHVHTRKARGLDSVILPNDLPERTCEEIRTFLKDGEWYVSKGIPHRRGYLLYGVPGTGKSSLALAVAGELGMDIYILSLADKHLSDADLVGLLMRVNRRSIVLFEDVDAVFDERRKKSEEDSTGVTFSGLLNALDGVASKEGVVLFMSTNHIEKLDPALIRPGRADVKIEFFRATHSQLERLFTRFFPQHGPAAAVFADTVGTGTITMAEAQEYLLRYRDDPKAVLENAAQLGPKSTENSLSGMSVVPKSLPCASAGCEMVLSSPSTQSLPEPTGSDSPQPNPA